ncbi:hypothetical protein DICVIV_09269 [Dictyocaulus viviparus]|uniref:Thioredoxin domain-containing protein n=1 Tax=Dictyocaulus viviparus TaxID=29172 RepID=A0A0D8XLV2_DICVI|nr:hypothetical protein DICVIV_09269 [Dictyocaulus viviparus]
MRDFSDYPSSQNPTLVSSAAQSTTDTIDENVFDSSVVLNDEEDINAVACVDVNIVQSLRRVFTAKNMAKLVLFFFGVVLSNYLWNIFVEVYSRPTILKPRGPLPFFSNSSRNYVLDYYNGDFQLEQILRDYDLLFVMYYAPWSFHSRNLKHPYEVIAFIFHSHKNVRFVAVNCWTTAGECRKVYKIYQYPVIVAYSSNVHTIYQGEQSVDHLYRWVVNIRNPLRYIGSTEVLENLKHECHLSVVGYFPFKNISTPCQYRSFAAAAMMLHSGLLEAEYTCLGVITSTHLANEIRMRFEGDIVVYTQGNETMTEWPLSISFTAENIVEWVKRKRSEAVVKWIQFNRNTEYMTEQFAKLLNESAVLLLVTPLAVVYRGQPDILIFTELAKEYWNCDEGNLSLPRNAENHRIVSSNDILACAQILEGIVKMDLCCRSLLPAVDWNIACASSAKYKWEDEENVVKVSYDEHLRSHWTEQRKQVFYKVAHSLYAILSRCCSEYERISQRELTSVHKANAIKLSQDHEIEMTSLCMRGRLFNYMKYPLINKDLNPFEGSRPNENTIRGTGCSRRHENDTLTFVVLDSIHYYYFLNKWGLQNAQLPLIIAIDTKRELFSVMDGSLSQYRVREFISDYHSNLVSDHLLSEEDSTSRFIEGNEAQTCNNKQLKEENQVIERLTLLTLHNLIENRRNTTHDVVVFFSGGVWHTPSAIAMHVYHSTASYFASSRDLIKFYVIDTTRNEMPYNFNFERIPAIVIFLANRTDVSWKYPDSLPISHPNLLSFVLSHCSIRLRWKMALTNCGRVCVIQNRRRLYKRKEKLLIAIYGIKGRLYQTEHIKRIDHLVKQLRVVRRLLNVLHIALRQYETLAEDSVTSLLHGSLFEDYFKDM